jgi:hypothetical protein
MHFLLKYAGTAQALAKGLSKRPLPPSVRGLKPKAALPQKPISWTADPKQVAAWAGKTASVKYAAMRDEFVEIKLAKVPEHIKQRWGKMALELAKKERTPKVGKELVMKSLGGGRVGGTGKAVLEGLR